MIYQEKEWKFDSTAIFKTISFRQIINKGLH
ncbi:MAG: hypothetical protein HeimC3_47030, partial [Candidatus Heimdallarchaeota archaeon LC_3]